MASVETRCLPYLRALGDPSRWRIVKELLKAPQTVGTLVSSLGMNQYNVSKHVRILRDVGIVTTVKAGKFVHVAITSEFSTHLSADSSTLNLGCCTFHFDKG
jgi:DNA-binding transcriptional ArsR family regulator